MLKLWFNGVSFQTHFSLNLKPPFPYSKFSTTGSNFSSMVDFMVNSLGFSREEAITTWSKASSPNLKKPIENPVLVVDCLKQRGFSNTQIKKLVSSSPRLLNCRVDKTLIPKLNALEELGISGSNLAVIVSSNSSILRRGFKTKVEPMIIYMKSIMGTNETLFKVLRRSFWLTSADVVTRLKPNIEIFRKYGFSNEKILKIISHHGEFFGHDSKRLERILIKVDKELKISPKSASFHNAVVLLASLSEKTLEAKFQIFKSYGWTDSHVKLLFRKLPRCFVLSEPVIRQRLDFFMNELGCEPDYLAQRPYVMTYSMKHRVLPRYTVLRVLKERKLLTAEVSLLTAVCSCESAFLKKFVLPYKDVLPELCKAYICREENRL